MAKVVITGGSGMLGRWVVRHFVEQGYEVVNVDTQALADCLCRTIIADLNNLGEVYGVLTGADAVVHLAAIPAANIKTSEVTFQNNVMSTYNILEAAAGLGIRKTVIASSESSYGICFAVNPLGPQYVPMDEDHPQLPEDSYGLSKVVNEQTAGMFHRRTGMQVVSLRIGMSLIRRLMNVFLLLSMIQRSVTVFYGVILIHGMLPQLANWPLKRTD